jgi:hypothetical protein
MSLLDTLKLKSMDSPVPSSTADAVFLRKKDIWIGALKKRVNPIHYNNHTLYASLNTDKHASWYRLKLLRAIRRCSVYKEELLAAAWHPRRIEQWISAGRWDLLE